MDNRDPGAKEKSVKSVRIESGLFLPVTKRSNAVHQVGFSCIHQIRTHDLLQYDQSVIADSSRDPAAEPLFSNIRQWVISPSEINWLVSSSASLGIRIWSIFPCGTSILAQKR